MYVWSVFNLGMGFEVEYIDSITGFHVIVESSPRVFDVGYGGEGIYVESTPLRYGV